MLLKRSGAYRQARLITLPALLLFAYEGVVIAHLAALGNWDALIGPGIILIAFASYFLVIVGLVLNVVALFAPFAFFANARALRHVRANVERGAPLATFQPDLSLALRDGETLTMTTHRQVARRNAINTIRIILTSAIMLLLLVLSGEAFILPLVPAATNYLPSLITAITSNVPPPAPNFSIWDWLALAFPPAVTLACIPLLILISRSDLSSQIIADDSGITQSGPRRRTRFIPWSDIRVFLRGADSELDKADGGYMLWGREHFFKFEIISIASMRRLQKMAAQQDRPAPDLPYLFDGGYERYISDARRLLATIRSRSGEPLRARASATRWARWGRRRFPTLAIELEDALAAPVATSPWQPTPESITAVPLEGSLGTLIVLRPRLSWLRVAVGTLAWLIPSLLLVGACGGFFGIFLYIPLSTAPYLEDQSAQVTILIIVGILAFSALLASLLLAIARQRSRVPILLTDDLGITKGTGHQTATALRWADIRAWAILPPPPGDRDGPTYFLFTEGDYFTWREPDDAQLAGRGIQGDRHLAYHERAAALHALIAARTALPLRELSLPKSANTLTA